MLNYRFKLHWLAIFCTLIPAFAVHISWITAIVFETIDPCFPYWSDCVSISRTARQFPASLLFKGMMIPHAVLTIVVWYLSVKWIRGYHVAGKSLTVIKGLSLIAGISMIVYLAALGVHGEEFRFARRTGVIISFSFTYLMQLLLYRKLIAVKDIIQMSPRLLFYQKWLCIVLLCIGIGNVLLDMFYADFHKWNDAIEWWFCLFLYGYFLTIASAWKQTGFRITKSK